MPAKAVKEAHKVFNDLHSARSTDEGAWSKALSNLYVKVRSLPPASLPPFLFSRWQLAHLTQPFNPVPYPSLLTLLCHQCSGSEFAEAFMNEHGSVLILELPLKAFPKSGVIFHGVAQCVTELAKYHPDPEHIVMRMESCDLAKELKAGAGKFASDAWVFDKILEALTCIRQHHKD